MLAAALVTLAYAAPASAQVSTGDSPTSGGVSQPVASTPPSVSGTERDGSTLTGDDGEWGAFVTTEHIWLRCGAGGTGCSQVSSASTYGLTASDVGKGYP